MSVDHRAIRVADPGSRVLGIDAGGTKTHLAIGIVDGRSGPRVEIERVVPTSGWRTGDRERDGAALATLVSDVFGPDAEALDVLRLPAVVGAHGCDSTAQCIQLESSLVRAGMADVRVVNDAELMPATAGVGDGIGVVCGTGSIAVARDSAGQLLTAGGWGWVLGDEGSAAGLVREAARAVLTGLDEAEPTDSLRQLMFHAFDVPDGPELAMALTRRSDAAWWGSHAAAVFSAADAGSARAIGVIVAGGRALALLVARLLRRMVDIGPSSANTSETRVVVAGGSVVLSQQRLRSAFTDALAESHPTVKPLFLSSPPVIGALYLAAAAPARPRRRPDTPIPVPEVAP